jgi:hypothetical protein
MIRRYATLMGVMLALCAMASPLTAQTKAMAVSHDLEGKTNCLMCHTAGAMEPVPDVPASHEGRVNEQCMMCHAADSPMVTMGASDISHDLEGKANCMMCHAAGVMEPVPDVPASHEGRGVETCQWCHKAAGL